MDEIKNCLANRRAIYIAIIDLIDQVPDTDSDIAGRVVRATSRNLYLDLVREIDSRLDGGSYFG